MYTGQPITILSHDRLPVDAVCGAPPMSLTVSNSIGVCKLLPDTAVSPLLFFGLHLHPGPGGVVVLFHFTIVRPRQYPLPLLFPAGDLPNFSAVFGWLASIIFISLSCSSQTLYAYKAREPKSSLHHLSATLL